MASEHAYENSEDMLSGARVARLKFVVFPQNVNIPGETSALARALFLHVPEMARRMGTELSKDEGHPPQVSVTDQSLVRLIAADLAEARPYANWLASHIGPETGAMFAKGGENAFDHILDSFAQERGFKRDDILSQERGDNSPSLAIAAAIRAGMDR